MKHVNLNGQEESVRRFVLGLAVETEGAVLELDGRPVARVLPPAERNGESPSPDEWTDERNDRRCELIDKELDGTLAPDEQTELEDLQEQMLRYRHRVAPLPLAHARKLLDELENKAAAKNSGPSS
jgi:hypothetical protein